MLIWHVDVTGRAYAKGLGLGRALIRGGQCWQLCRTHGVSDRHFLRPEKVPGAAQEISRISAVYDPSYEILYGAFEASAKPSPRRTFRAPKWLSSVPQEIPAKSFVREAIILLFVVFEDLPRLSRRQTTRNPKNSVRRTS